MSDLCWLTDEQTATLLRCFPKSHGRPRVDDRRVLSGVISINRNGLRWRDAPAEYSRLKRWSEKGIFAKMQLELANQGRKTGTLMIDATHLKTHQMASSMGLKNRGRGCLIGRTKAFRQKFETAGFH